MRKVGFESMRFDIYGLHLYTVTSCSLGHFVRELMSVRCTQDQMETLVRLGEVRVNELSRIHSDK